MSVLGLKINNLDQAASDGRTFSRINPISGEVASEVAAASLEDARQAVNAAAKAFPAWAAIGPGQRRKLLNAAADKLQAKTPDFVAAMAAETGATAGWAMFNVGLAADMLREAASLTTQITGEIIPSNRPGSLAMGLRQPAGVVLSMAPWNAPVILGVRSLATPLACGNTVVMKTSEICPRTHRLIVDALHDAGLPEGVLNAVSNAPEDARGHRRGDDRPPGRAPCQLHRLHPRRPHHRRDGGPLSQARPAGTRRQGAVRRARRCRYRRGRRGGRLRRLHEPGPDLHVDRAHRRR
jgi:acyl-CoA reductase-like NAD-dependent aldehyde dehydrogenase